MDHEASLHVTHTNTSVCAQIPEVDLIFRQAAFGSQIH
jgi:hypothetical protein